MTGERKPKMSINEIKAAVLELEPGERADLIGYLRNSLCIDPEADAAWRAEVRRRIERIRAGRRGMVRRRGGSRGTGSRSVRVLMSDEARADLREAGAYFGRGGSEAGAAFVAEVRRGIQCIRDYPQIGSPHELGSRALLLNRFPYSLVYLLTIARIVAVSHHSRDQTYWHSRVDPPLPNPPPRRPDPGG